MFGSEDYLALSGIQHFSFCRRQWALIHIDQIWRENLLTVEGELMHKRAHDEGLRERRGDVIVVRGLTVRSNRLKVLGQCDVVEFHQDQEGFSLAGEEGCWRALPVEYKHGRQKASDADRLQLCAQAMCLEEMLATNIEYGCLYYGATHARERVALNGALRENVERLFAEMWQLYQSHHTPKVRQSKACSSCSLFERCMPKESTKSVAKYIDDTLGELA